MILCFSGTGNSRYVADRIAAVTKEEIIDLNAKIKNHDTSVVNCDKNITIVAPTYAWRLPGVVSDWIEKSNLSGAKRAWFVMTCGSEIGGAAKYNKILCDKTGIEYMGTMQIRMPENYVAMFPVPSAKKAKEIIAKAKPDITKAAEAIKNEKCFPAPRNNVYDRFVSEVINPVFYRWFVKADAFCADDRCTGCGACVALCPLNNITLKNNHPVWGDNCTHCMACICHCPAEAIEYGGKSKGKPRYRCPES